MRRDTVKRYNIEQRGFVLFVYSRGRASAWYTVAVRRTYSILTMYSDGLYVSLRPGAPRLPHPQSPMVTHSLYSHSV